MWFDKWCRFCFYRRYCIEERVLVCVLFVLYFWLWYGGIFESFILFIRLYLFNIIINLLTFEIKLVLFCRLSFFVIVCILIGEIVFCCSFEISLMFFRWLIIMLFMEFVWRRWINFVVFIIRIFMFVCLVLKIDWSKL